MKATQLFHFLLKLVSPIALLYLLLQFIDDVFFSWLIAIVVGGFEAWVLWKYLFPIISDMIGNFFFNPNAPDDESREIVDQLTAQRRYEEALAVLHDDVLKHPSQLHFQERYIAYLIDPMARYDLVASVLTELGRSHRWSKEVRARLLYRAGHIYSHYLHQETIAQELWQETIKRYPKTTYAQSAKQRINP